jgi:hypothetical protein
MKDAILAAILVLAIAGAVFFGVDLHSGSLTQDNLMPKPVASGGLAGCVAAALIIACHLVVKHNL